MSPMDLLALTSELEAAKLEIITQRQKILGLQEEIKMKKKTPRSFDLVLKQSMTVKAKSKSFPVLHRAYLCTFSGASGLPFTSWRRNAL